MSSPAVNTENIRRLEEELLEAKKDSERASEDLKRALEDLVNTTAKNSEESKQRINQLSNLFESQWGKLMESLVEGDLVRILRERGINVNETATRSKGQVNGEHYEFDIVAYNDDEIVIVEVKTTLRVKHVRKFLYRLDQVKKWIPRFKGYKIHGTVAFLRAEEESEVFAENQHLWVIRATGDSASIMNASDFVPNKW